MDRQKLPQMTVVTTTTTATATTTMILPPSLGALATVFSESFVLYLNLLDRLPGGPIILRYIRLSYKNDPIRSVFELALFLFAVHYFLMSKRKENKDVLKLSKREIDGLCADWKPEPLLDPVTDEEKWQLKCVPVIHGQNGAHISVSLQHSKGTQRQVVNLASYDFLNLNESERVKEAAKDTISSTGVGACGPPNFYGTQDVHVRLEEDLANYFGGEQAIIYGQDFVTAGSVIPAFLKRGDLCVVDSGVNIAIQKALIVSRCDIEWFDHNDTEHLEQILKEIKPVLDKQKPIKRRFIVTEGLFANTGDLPKLPEIVRLKNKYKYRLFLDETLSIGSLGKSGRGVVEHFDIPRSEISITIGSLANSLASSGGFCVGVNPMVHHQRISSLAYVFSASLPPYSARAASQSLREIGEDLDKDGKSKLVSKLHDNISFVRATLAKSIPTQYLSIVSEKLSPIIHLQLNEKYRESLGFPLFYGSAEFLNTGKPSRTLNEFSHSLNWESFILQKIIDGCLLQYGILITRSHNILKHENLPLTPPHLMVMVKVGVEQEELNALSKALSAVVPEVCSRYASEASFLSSTNELINY